jgi:hypothetical protein
LVNSRDIFGQIFETGEPCLFFSLGELALERAVLLGGLGHLTGLVNSPGIQVNIYTEDMRPYLLEERRGRVAISKFILFPHLKNSLKDTSIVNIGMQRDM